MQILVEAFAKKEKLPIIFYFDTNDVSDKVDEILKNFNNIDFEKTKNLLNDDDFKFEEIREWILEPEVLFITLLYIWLVRELDKLWDRVWDDSVITIKEISKIGGLA